MDILIVILVGIAAGYLAGLVMKGGGFGILINLIVGIIGSFVGGWLLGELGVSLFDDMGWLGVLIKAFIGAVILLFIISLFKKK